MANEAGYWERVSLGRLSRRRALTGAATLGAGAAALRKGNNRCLRFGFGFAIEFLFDAL